MLPVDARLDSRFGELVLGKIGRNHREEPLSG
jgi:hypothetical protein